VTQPTKAEFQKLSELATTLDKRVELVQSQVDAVGKLTEKVEQSHDKLRELVADLKAEVRGLAGTVEEMKKKIDESDRRLWMLVGLIVAAVLTFVANIVVALVRK
jgi:chromosome segregation ATPase